MESNVSENMYAHEFNNEIYVEFVKDGRSSNLHMTREFAEKLMKSLENILKVGQNSDRDWIKFDEITPPKSDDPTNPGGVYYEVMLNSGEISRLCWWLNHWYCSLDNGNVLYWRPLENKS